MPDPHHSRLTWGTPASVFHGLCHREHERGGVARRLAELAVEGYGRPAFGGPLTET